MATGILSTAAKDHNYAEISNALILIAVLAWAVLIAVTVIIAALKRRLPPWDLGNLENTLPLFTFVAACAVLCNRLSSAYPLILHLIGIISALAWIALTWQNIRNLKRHRLTALRDQVHGAGCCPAWPPRAWRSWLRTWRAAPDSAHGSSPRWPSGSRRSGSTWW
ncbi:hypothetical protein [Mycobacterium scrofulaceum]|uniref:hypothetical protein n=1 Tax=Mycobacterium scrofulaceum TaxID=1783 RepID=UPI0022B232B1|nr:hypothetical protein [Mycobacterium scrofulaceum]